MSLQNTSIGLSLILRPCCHWPTPASGCGSQMEFSSSLAREQHRSTSCRRDWKRLNPQKILGALINGATASAYSGYYYRTPDLILTTSATVQLSVPPDMCWRPKPVTKLICERELFKFLWFPLSYVLPNSRNSLKLRSTTNPRARIRNSDD